MSSHHDPPPANMPAAQSSNFDLAVVSIASLAVVLLVCNIIAFACFPPLCPPTGVWRRRRRDADDDADQAATPSGDAAAAVTSAVIPIRSYRMRPDEDYDAEAATAAANAEWCCCSVCQLVFVDGEEVKEMPRFGHLFHAPCIDMWLYSHPTCPLCRTKVDEGDAAAGDRR